MMAFSYDASALEKDLNWVRFRVGDTDSTDAQLDDAEITALISLHQSRELAAVASARAIAAKYARFGAMKEAEAFTLLADTIEREIVPGYLL